MQRWIKQVEQQPHRFFIIASLVTVFVIGFVDYATSREISLSAFYLLAVGMAAWFVGRRFAGFISVLSVLISLAGDYTTGARYSSPFVPCWNASILLAFYLVVVWLLTRLRSLQKELEARVIQRTAALTEEMAERERLSIVSRGALHCQLGWPTRPP